MPPILRAANPILVLRLLLAALVVGLSLAAAGAGLIWRAGAPDGIGGAAVAAGGLALLTACGLALISLRQAGTMEAALLGLRRETTRQLATERAVRPLQRPDAVGPLTSGIVHDFNNQLTTISSNVELLARRLPPESAALRRLSDAAIQGVQRAAALSHRLLALSRQQEPDPEPLDLGRLLGSMAPLLRRMLGEGVRLETSSAEGLWPVWADASQCEAMLLHLAANGRDNMPDGGTLRIAIGNETVDCTDPDLPPGQYVVLTVADTGPDASAADAEARLAAIAGNARHCRGRVRRAGSNGFRLHFPRYMPQPRPQPAARGDSGNQTILVVEDDDDLRQAAAEALRQIGYTVLDAADAMQGIQLIADRGGIDLLLADIGLPGGVDGRALADAARSAAPGLKVLFTTGYRSAAGDPLLLPKPFSLDQLAAKVREALGACAPATPVAETTAVLASSGT